MRRSLFIVLIALILVPLVSQPVAGQSRLSDESWFDLKANLTFDGGELISPDDGFSIQREGAWVDIQLLIDTVLSADIDFVFLKLNGVTVLFNPRTYRAKLSEHGTEQSIEAYGEAFDPSVDSQFYDQMSGGVVWTNPESPILLLSLAAIALASCAFWIGKRYLR
ncbi:MAG: hypothetical protein JSW61_05405 [Candidatus Thorarchaeota archaeon]|nr:MAG: hypothetical protein JSW61_05405 [Candidatus Thorarchaeota archaeon]